MRVSITMSSPKLDGSRNFARVSTMGKPTTSNSRRRSAFFQPAASNK